MTQGSAPDNTAVVKSLVSPAAGPRVVELQSVTRTYDSGDLQVLAVNDISLTVAAGETIALTGPSGSGKTTLLNLIGALDHPSQGSICVLDMLLTSATERALTAFRARCLGFVFQDPYLLPGLSALNNVVASRLPWERRGTLEVRARDLLAQVGLTERMHHTPARLSGGEKQRVGIARALMGNPPLLLADEPTGNLDAHTTAEVLDLLADLQQRRGFTVIFATHDPAVAARVDRTVHLVGGRVVAHPAEASGQVTRDARS